MGVDLREKKALTKELEGLGFTWSETTKGHIKAVGPDNVTFTFSLGGTGRSVLNQRARLKRWIRDHTVEPVKEPTPQQKGPDMPFNDKDKPGSYVFIDGLWRCEKCDFTSDVYTSMVGHQGKHTTKKRASAVKPMEERKSVGRAGNMMAKDPMKMTVQELFDTLEELRYALVAAEEKLTTTEQLLEIAENESSEGRAALEWFRQMQALMPKLPS